MIISSKVSQIIQEVEALQACQGNPHVVMLCGQGVYHTNNSADGSATVAILTELCERELYDMVRTRVKVRARARARV